MKSHPQKVTYSIYEMFGKGKVIGTQTRSWLPGLTGRGGESVIVGEKQEGVFWVMELSFILILVRLAQIHVYINIHVTSSPESQFAL